MGQADTTQIEIENKIIAAMGCTRPQISQIAVEGIDMNTVCKLLQQRRRVAELFLQTSVSDTENREMYKNLFLQHNEMLKQYLFL